MALTEIKQDGLDDEAVNEAKLQISNAGSNGDFLQKQSGNTGGLTWAAAGSGTPEGTAILSTGETGTAKFLRIDGDNSCSWQVPSTTDSTKMPLAGGTFTGDVTFDNQSSAGRDIIWDESRPDGQPERYYDMTLFKEKLGYIPETTLKEGLRKTIDWFESNIDKIN